MLDFFKELMSAFKSTAVERVKNPFIGAFCFSWVAFNWRSILVVLFSGKSIEEKIEWINTNSNLVHALIYPAILSGLILGVLPLVSALVMWVQDKPLGFVMRKYMERDEQTLDRKIGVEKKRALASVAFKRVVADEELEIQRLNALIQTSKDQSDKLTAQVKTLSDENEQLKAASELIAAKEKELNNLAEETIKSALALNEASTKNFALQGEIKKLNERIKELEKSNKNTSVFDGIAGFGAPDQQSRFRITPNNETIIFDRSAPTPANAKNKDRNQ